MAVSATDILVVSIDSTTGWRAAARELRESLERAGARVVGVGTGPVPNVRTFALTDLTQARAARRACLAGIAEHGPRAVIYCSITATLLWPTPGAVWLDTIAAENRPGRHGVWQRPVERRRLAQAPLVMAMSPQSLQPLGDGIEHVVLPVAVDRSGPPPPRRDIAAITYAGDPQKKRLDHVLAAWAEARKGEETLVVAGIDDAPRPDGVRVAGRLPQDEYRELLRRARVFVAAPRREDHGIAPLEALADGCMLVTTRAPGPYPALALAEQLDPRLVGDDLAGQLRIALDDPRPDYADHAAELLAPFSRQAVDRTVGERVLPRLLAAR